MSTENDGAVAYGRLRLHIDVPDLEETWLDGYESGQKGVEESKNPYLMDSEEYHHWNDGWWAGFYNEAPLFNYSGEVINSSVKKQSEKPILTYLQQAHSIQLRQWFLFVAEICGGIIASFAAYQLVDMVL